MPMKKNKPQTQPVLKGATAQIEAAQRAVLLEHVQTFLDIGERWSQQQKPVILSTRALKVQDFLDSKPFGCNNRKVAQLMSIVLDEPIAVVSSARRYTRGLFVTADEGYTFMWNGHDCWRRNNGFRLKHRDMRMFQLASREEIAAYIGEANYLMLRQLAEILDSLPNDKLCPSCGEAFEDCDCEDEDGAEPGEDEEEEEDEDEEEEPVQEFTY